MAEKSLRMRVADVIGFSNDSKEARAIYMLVDKIEVLEKELDKRVPKEGGKHW